MRKAPDPLAFIMRYTELQELPTKHRQTLHKMISRLEDVDIQAEIDELWKRRGHYSYTLSLFGGRFKFNTNNYINGDVMHPKEKGPATPEDGLIQRLRKNQLQTLSEDDMMVIRVAIKRYIDWLEVKKEKEKERKRIENDKRWETLQ